MTRSRSPYLWRRAEAATTVVAALAGRSCGVAAVFFFTLLIGRRLGAAESGYFFSFQAWSAFLSVLVGMGLPIFVLRAVVRADDTGNLSLSSQLLRRSILAVAGASVMLLIPSFFARNWIVSAFAPPGAPSSLPWLAAAAAGVLMILRLYAEAIKARFKPHRAVLLQFAFVPMVATVIFVLFLLFVDDPRSTVPMFAYLLAGTVGMAAAALTWHRTSGPMSPRSAPVSTGVRHTRGLPLLWAITVFEMGYESLPYIILARVGSGEDIGQFGAAMRITAVAGMGLTAVASVYAPKFGRAFHRGEPRAMARYLRASQVAAFASYAPWLPFLLIFPEAIMSFFGPDFVDGAYLLIILSVGQLVNAATGTVNVFLQLARREALTLAVSAGSMVAMIVGGVVCARLWGVAGVATQYAAILAARNGFLWFAVKRLTGVSEPR